MSDDATEDQKITIYHVKGGSHVDTDNLIDCYFEAQASPDSYQFFGSGNEHIPTIPEFLSSGTPGFQFIRAGILWTVSDFQIDPTNASGRWRNPRNPAKGDDDGHFQAMSGGGTQAGGGVTQSASAAKAG